MKTDDIFTSLLNERLNAWSDEYDILTDAQFGFESGYSTVDAIAILNSFIQKQFSDKKAVLLFYRLAKMF